MGVSIGKNVKNISGLIDEGSLANGIKDQLAGKTKLDEAGMREALQALTQRQQTDQAKQREGAGAKNKAEGEATVLRSRIRDRLDNAKERIVDAEQEAVDRAKRAARATDTYVHSHPWQAVGAAAAVGLAIGVLLGRR